MLPGPHGFEAGVLVAHSDFVTRAESVESHLLDEGFAGHLRVQHLERDEVEAFIRRQLPPGEGANLFTAQRMALIGLTSGGDPVVVNRLARRILQTEPDVSAGGLRAKFRQKWRRYVWKPSGIKSIPGPDVSAAGDAIALPRVRARRYALSMRLPAGMIICLGAAWLAAGGALERPDLAAVVGLMRDHILPRTDIVPGDVVVGLAATGVHSNGFSLVRKIVADAGLKWEAPAPFAPAQNLGEAFLMPTRLYVRSCLAAIRESRAVKALAHITGGGFVENIPRVLPGGLGIRVALERVPVLPVFKWLAATGRIAEREMLRTFNCGIGMVAVLDKNTAEAATESLAKHGENVVRLGEVVAAEGGGAISFSGHLDLSWPKR